MSFDKFSLSTASAWMLIQAFFQPSEVNLSHQLTMEPLDLEIIEHIFAKVVAA